MQYKLHRIMNDSSVICKHTVLFYLCDEKLIEDRLIYWSRHYLFQFPFKNYLFQLSLHLMKVMLFTLQKKVMLFVFGTMHSV